LYDEGILSIPTELWELRVFYKATVQDCTPELHLSVFLGEGSPSSIKQLSSQFCSNQLDTHVP
jgi:hypothetical protein